LKNSRLNIHGATAEGAAVRRWWTERKDRLFRIAISLMFIAALLWLGYQFWRLLGQTQFGALDLRLLHRLVRDWFAGRPIYSFARDAIHPPATYVLLWPLLGWLEVTAARWLWAATTIAALGWLSFLSVRESGARNRQERALAALMVLSAYATGAAIGNGQLIIHILPMLVAGLLLLRRPEPSWRSDLLAGALVLFTLIKPSISAPFFWIVLFAGNSLRPALVAASGYAALTFLALSFQPGDFTAHLRDLAARSGAVAIEPGQGNVNNLHIWMGSAGMGEWLMPASLLVLLITGVWVYRHRRVDLWLLMGVTAYVARLWTYHRWYDDLLILLPMIALFRLASHSPDRPGGDMLAGALLAVTILAMLAPGGLFLFPAPWNAWYVGAQLGIWVLGLIFLAVQARRERRRVHSFAT
jgi:hypothetical protein